MPSRRKGELSFRTSNGMLVFLEESHQLPLVHLEFVLRSGSSADPTGAEGLTRLVAQMLRMGTRNLSNGEVEEKIDSLGAHLSIQTSHSAVVLHTVVIRRNLEPFMALLAELLCQPAFRAKDFSHVKHETISGIIDMRDNDRALATKCFREQLFENHPYGRNPGGSVRSVRSIKKAAVVDLYRKQYVGRNIVVGVAGAVDGAELKRLLEKHFGRLPAGRATSVDVAEPQLKQGRRLVIVDKPDRTQSQIIIGTLGTQAKDRDHTALQVANTVFGGTFTARLMREIRSKRGWSYGASSRLGLQRQREAWSMWTFPAARDTAECIRVQLDLYEQWLHEGVTEDELQFAKAYLSNSYAFERDTAAKRVSLRLDSEILGLPRDYHKTHLARVERTSRNQANAAVKRRLSSRDVLVVVVATAKTVRAELEKLPALSELKVLPYQRV